MDYSNETPLGFWGTESEQVISRQYPIHKACRDGDSVMLSRAVAVATPDQLVAEDQFYGWTPIHWAAYFGKSDCLSGLLRSGVNVNIRTSRFQQTPSHIAAFGGHPSCLLELIKSGADFHARDYLGEISLHKAARVGNVECIRTLVSNGTNANICNNNGHTAGDLSRMQNFKECTHLLELASMEGTNGHHVVNGTSGSHVSNGNGHVNGWGHTNGHQNGHVTRKRTFDDESIPIMKRPRVAGKPQHRLGYGYLSGSNCIFAAHLCTSQPSDQDTMDCSAADTSVTSSADDVSMTSNGAVTSFPVRDPYQESGMKGSISPVYTNGYY